MNETQENAEQNEKTPNQDAALSNNDTNMKKARFEKGKMVPFIRVRFPGHNKSYPFLLGKRKLTYGQKVVAMSDRGMAVGYVNSFPYKISYNKGLEPLKTINKIATNEDLENEKVNYKKQKETEVICQNLIEKHKLDMNLTHVEFTQFGKKVVFYFTASERVDFRGLVKDLVNDLKIRIELRQISLRDRAASVGNIGPCGRELCCSSFLSKYGNVNIKMAKNQNLTINFGKLKGVCGQLKCCLKYEDEVYTHKRKKLPKENSIIQTRNGTIGKVKKLHLLSEQFDLLSTKGMIKRFVVDEFEKELKNYKFPRQFDHISFDNSKVIGFQESEDKKARERREEIDKIVEQTTNEIKETPIENLIIESTT